MSWLAEELQVTITKQARTARGIGIATRASETPILFHAEARERQDELRDVLVAWVRTLWESYGAGTYDSDNTLTGLASWLLRHPSWCRSHPAADELWDEIRDSVRRAVQIIDLAPDRVFLGVCDIRQEGGTVCEGLLYAREGRRFTRCHGCGTEWDVDQRRRYLLGRMPHRLANSVQMSRLLASLGMELASSTIRTWARPRTVGGEAQPPRLPARGQDEKGRPLYMVGDVLTILFPAADHDLAKTAA
ncbi:hypothetical protein [Saccharopolyspora sp. NPDC002376]